MATTWVVVANSSAVSFFSVSGQEIKRIEQIDFPPGRERASELLSDKPGTTFDSMGEGRHSYSTEVDVHTHEQEVWAHQIAEKLRHAWDRQEFQRLALIAPPDFLGELRQAIPNSVKKTIWKEVNKEIPNFLSEHEQKLRVSELLGLPFSPPTRKVH